MKFFNLILFWTVCGNLFAQEYLSISKGCNFKGEEKGSEYYSFDPSAEATKIVKQVLDGAGALSYNSIILKEANVENAMATTEGKRRYILYSTTFLEKFKGDAKTKWAAYTVLAHEIGHHLNAHDFSEKDPKKRKQMELEADKFAGAICRTLGATLTEASAGMESMKLEGETNTHPAKSARTAAVANGWKLQDELLTNPSTENGEMRVATESLSGKISLIHSGIEVILYSAKKSSTLTTFHFLVKNTTSEDQLLFVYLGPNLQAIPAGIVDYEDYFAAEDIILEGTPIAYKSGRYHNILVGDNAMSYFKVNFKNAKLTSMEMVPEIRITISVGNNPKKTLAFKNIPLPYEMKK